MKGTASGTESGEIGSYQRRERIAARWRDCHPRSNQAPWGAAETDL